MAAEFDGPRESFGSESDADWRAEIVEVTRGCPRFRLSHRGRLLGAVQLAIAARHNVLNACAAAAAASDAGVAWPAIRAGLESFAGLQRRLELVHDGPFGTVVDDFAHLPAEIAGGLAAVREWFPGRRIYCVFQPHQASRTAALLDELAVSLHNADTVHVAEIFRAREGAAQPGEVRAGDLAAAVARRGTAAVAPGDDAAILPRLWADLRPDDVLVTMGAGDIGKIAHEFAQRIRKNHSPQ